MKQWEECAPSMNVLKCTNNVLLCLVLLPKRPILRFFPLQKKTAFLQTDDQTNSSQTSWRDFPPTFARWHTGEKQNTYL